MADDSTGNNPAVALHEVVITKRWLAETGPHYLAMVALIFIVIRLVRQMVGESSLLVELVIVLVVAFSYVNVVRRLHIAPSSWVDDEE